MHDWRMDLQTIKMNTWLEKGLTPYWNERMIEESAYRLF